MDTVVVRDVVLNLAQWCFMKRGEFGKLEVYFVGGDCVSLDDEQIQQLTERLDASECAAHRRLSTQIVDALT